MRRGFLKADLQADRFNWSVDEDAIAEAALFDGKLALLTNAPDLTAPPPSRATRRWPISSGASAY